MVAELDRAARRIEALKLKVVAAADRAGTAKDAGFTDTNAWVAKTTTVSRSDAARQVALATDLDSGHDATAEALDAGLVSPGHAAVIVQATSQLPARCSAEQRQVVEADAGGEGRPGSAPTSCAGSPGGRSRPSNPTRAWWMPTRTSSVRTEEQAAHDKCSFTLHDNGDGTTTGHFTVPALAAAILAKIIDTMTAPRRMREPGSTEPAGAVVRLAAPPRARVRRAPRAPAHRPPAPQDRRHRGRHHRPHRPARRHEGSPARHRRDPLGRRSPTPRLQRRDPARRARRQVSRPRPRPHLPALLRIPASRERARTHHLRRHRLRTPLRLVRAAPPKALGPRRKDRPRQRRSRCATDTTNGSTTPASTTSPCPTAASDSAGARDMERDWHQSVRGTAPNDGYLDGGAAGRPCPDSGCGAPSRRRSVRSTSYE